MTKTSKMSKMSNVPSEVFEQWIDILIMFKQSNPDKTVFLTKESLEEALVWYNKMQSSIKHLKPSIVNNSQEDNKPIDDDDKLKDDKPDNKEDDNKENDIQKDKNTDNKSSNIHNILEPNTDISHALNNHY